ncbi:DUF2721 domain-containing protein [soil metagenome]
MEINFTTPALLFPAISLLMLAYTNRFLALASIVRNLYASHKVSPSPLYVKQIRNMRRRIRLIRNMQFFGILSLLLCTLCMLSLFRGYPKVGEVLFTASILSMTTSLVLSLWEISLSGTALDMQLQDIEQIEPK